jgi:GT2 family glycosyltransferase
MKLICVDLESPLPDSPAPETGELWILVRLHRRPLGIIKSGGRGMSAIDLANAIGTELLEPIARHLAADGLGTTWDLADIETAWRRCPWSRTSALPITVAVCTRDRAAQLAACLESLTALEYPPDLLDLLVVDNAPSNEQTKEVVARYPSVRYVCEPMPGLDHARNRAVAEARGDIVAFTDDDVRVDAGWAAALSAAFEGEPDAACVTGLVVPDELDTPAQILFEQYGGFGRGFERRVFRVDAEGGQLATPLYGGTGRFGTGANMAFRRAAFDRIGRFDPALDVGTPTNGGGDLEMFFRVLKSGESLVYEPAAIVRHRHRRDYAALKTQLTNNGIGFYAYLARIGRAWPEERAAARRLGLWWFWRWSVRRLLRTFVARGAFPRDLVIAELIGSLKGASRYRAARRSAAA